MESVAHRKPRIIETSVINMNRVETRNTSVRPRNSSPAAVFEKVLGAFGSGGFNYDDFITHSKLLLADAPSPTELLDVLQRFELVEPLPEYAHDEILSLLNDAIERVGAQTGASDTAPNEMPASASALHPDEEVLTGEIFAVIVSAVLLGRVAAMRRDKQLPVLDPARKQDPAVSTLQGVRCFSWAASILRMRAPALYADPDYAGLVEMVPGVPPSTRLGQKALSGRSPQELAFVAGRHLAWYREERFVRLLVPQIADLEDLFLAALVIGNPGIPMRADTKRRVSALGDAIQPLLEPVQVDRLRGAFLRFVEEGGRTNLQRWASAADRTAARAGLLLSDDLRASAAMLEAEDAGAARERIDDLIVFVASDRYANLRKQIGLGGG